MWTRVERVLLVALTFAAALIAVSLAHREFGSAAPRERVREARGLVEYVQGWEDLLDVAVFDGDTSAPVVLIEFADLECPYCAALQTSVRKVRDRFSDSIAVAFIHFPLSYHRFARIAAHAAECAAAQGAFTAFVDGVYARQDSIGLRPWTAFAREAGVRDTASFMRCLTGSEAPARIDFGLAAGERISVRGTPTLLANGWRFGAVPSESTLVAVLDSMLAAGARRVASPGSPATSAR